MATVADLMTKDVLTVEPSDTIGEAAEKMHDANVGAVVVVEDMVRIVGIVTERDLMRAVAQRARAAEARVRQWMTADPLTIDPETSIEEAAKIMFDNNFRHLPVVKDGRPLGIVSLRVLARWAFDKSVQTTQWAPPGDSVVPRAGRMARGRLRPDVQRQERRAHPPASPYRDRGPARADREAADRRPVRHRPRRLTCGRQDARRRGRAPRGDPGPRRAVRRDRHRRGAVLRARDRARDRCARRARQARRRVRA